jgi:O-antigen ligase
LTHYLRLCLVPVYLVLCLVLGGASLAGYWSNMVLQLAAVPIIVWSLVARRSSPMPRSARQLAALLLLLLLLGIVQLVPLPPSIWTALPGRAPVAEGFRLIGEPLPWLPLTLTPYNAIGSLLWLLPAIAILLGILQLGGFKSAWLAWSLAGVTAVSVLIGALQLVGGEGSPWYFYEVTNYGSTTGFFSNANHLATLLVVTLPFIAALYRRGRSQGRSLQKSAALFVVLAGALVVLFVGLATNGSLAGLGLAAPVLTASLLLTLPPTSKWRITGIALIALLTVGSIAAVFSSPFQNNLTSQGAERSTVSRATSFAKSIEATKDYFPFGSGIGSFVQVYQQREDPGAVTQVYMNHVHGDYIEAVLETGLPGALLILLFLIWWARRTFDIWRAEEADPFAMAATIATAAILAHSAVDYPLRTAAISAVFAMCCGLMAEPRAQVRKKQVQAKDAARHLSAD